MGLVRRGEDEPGIFVDNPHFGLRRIVRIRADEVGLDVCEDRGSVEGSRQKQTTEKFKTNSAAVQEIRFGAWAEAHEDSRAGAFVSNSSPSASPDEGERGAAEQSSAAECTVGIFGCELARSRDDGPGDGVVSEGG